MSLIVADVGGTNARLAFQKNINSEISLIENFFYVRQVGRSPVE